MGSTTVGKRETFDENRLNLVNIALSEAKEDHSFFSETHFRHMLRVERMRTERSKAPFMLLLIDASKLAEKYPYSDEIGLVKTALSSCLRETDIRGWYQTERTFGIIFTEIPADTENFVDAIIQKIYTRICSRLDPDIIKNISISFHLFPKIAGSKNIDETFNINLYPDLAQKTIGRRLALAVKKLIDIAAADGCAFLTNPVLAVATNSPRQGPCFSVRTGWAITEEFFHSLNFVP